MKFAQFWMLGSAAALLSGSSSFAQPVPADYKQYQASLKGQGLSPLIPASSDYRPGYIFTILTDQSGMKVRRTVCSVAFTSPSRPISEVLLPTKRVRDSSFKIALSFLPDFLAKSVSAAFGIDASRVKTTDVAFEGLSTQEVALANELNPKSGKVVRRQIDRVCAANLADLDLKDDGTLKDDVFIVLKSTSADTFTFSSDYSRHIGAALSTKVDKIASSDDSWKASAADKQSLKLVKTASGPQIYIAANILRLASVAQLGKISSAVMADLAVAEPAPGDLDIITQR